MYMYVHAPHNTVAMGKGVCTYMYMYMYNIQVYYMHLLNSICRHMYTYNVLETKTNHHHYIKSVCRYLLSSRVSSGRGCEGERVVS